ncbi:MAG: protease inhibitor I42 family protein [Treponema sp.]|nr:protease inhibitor I42 family protein [Treponema sp.]
MKKTFKLFTISGIISMILSACASTSFKSQKETLELEGNPTTGYTWQFDIEDKTIVKIDEDVQYQGKKGMVGAPSKFVYTIHSLKAGETSIKFEYKRPWETVPADKTCTYKVKVSESGKIDLTESNSGSEAKAFKSVSMEEGLKMMQGDSGFILLDVRRPDEYQAGHIPGAVQLTNETMDREKAASVLPDKNQTVYVYCRSGRRSKLASQKLIDYGYKNIIEIGGIIDYSGKTEQ